MVVGQIWQSFWVSYDNIEKGKEDSAGMKAGPTTTRLGSRQLYFLFHTDGYECHSMPGRLIPAVLGKTTGSVLCVGEETLCHCPQEGNLTRGRTALS